ncbi:MAG: SRPBCC family protein [Sinimarinibacterium sp.]|jgi:hypothetical protein
MTVIRLERQIPAAPAAVYDLVTRPARWKEWHPSSLRADAHAMESLPAGTQFEEDIRSAGFVRHLRWRVMEGVPATRWSAHAVMNDGSRVSLLYELSAAPEGTRFVRTLDYRLQPWLLRRLNDLFMWRRVQRESNRALDNLVLMFS